MKTQLLFLSSFVGCILFGQTKLKEFPISSSVFSKHQKSNTIEGAFVAVEFEKTECISQGEIVALKHSISQNKERILSANPNVFKNLKAANGFVNPFRSKAGFDDHGYHTLNFQVDHDLSFVNKLKDYNCGTRTYDWSGGNHQGTDYILWPYPWKRMDESTMEVLAAAAGVIVEKKDGFNDKNCTNTGNPNWNGIVLEHADGTRTLYMHFKKNTTTSKAVGESVVAGELLGIAGSSGSSTTAHLHFEVRDVNFNVLDPYSGNCNTMNSNSLWQNQESYVVPRVNRISTHYVFTQDTTCPNIENTYEKSNFAVNDNWFVKLFLRDINHGDKIDMKIIAPDGSVWESWSWTDNWNVFYATAYVYWQRTINTSWPVGVYKVQATFGGQTYEQNFGVGVNMNIDENEASKLKLYPNPANNILHFEQAQNIKSVEILSMNGQLTSSKKIDSNKGEISVAELPKGTYILKVNMEKEVKHLKFIKN